MKWVPGPAHCRLEQRQHCWKVIQQRKVRLRSVCNYPTGYTIQPHSHPGVEHLTVISGTFNLGMGEKFDKSGGRALGAGGFAFMPPGMKHFAWTTGETVIQLHGVGPWRINYVNAADDPRNKK